MIELSPEVYTLIFVVAILIGVLAGYNIALVIGGVGAIVGFLTVGPLVATLANMRISAMLLNYNMLAIPLFTFMGAILAHSGIADKLYGALHMWLGGLRGGLALGTVLIGTLLAACLGVVQASVSMLTVVALGPMLKRGYSKELACGSVCAGGTLGILIPPSIMLVVLGPATGLSVGRLFMGAVFPGLLLSALYCGYIIIRSLINPRIAPAAPIEERNAPILIKTRMLLSSLVPPMVLILSVLGSIFFGIATVYEAAGVGAAAAVLLSLSYKKFSWQVLKHSLRETLRITGFVMLITCCAYFTVGIFMYLRCGVVIKDIILAIPMGRWGAFAAIMLTIFILGMFIDWVGIIMIIAPIVVPLTPVLGFNQLWFTLMICVNLQMAFLTPPFASAIFVCKGTARSELGITTMDIIRGVIPFIILIIVGLGICILFPQILLWLPDKMIRSSW